MVVFLKKYIQDTHTRARRQIVYSQGTFPFIHLSWIGAIPFFKPKFFYLYTYELSLPVGYIRNRFLGPFYYSHVFKSMFSISMYAQNVSHFWQSWNIHTWVWSLFFVNYCLAIYQAFSADWLIWPNFLYKSFTPSPSPHPTHTCHTHDWIILVSEMFCHTNHMSSTVTFCLYITFIYFSWAIYQRTTAPAKGVKVLNPLDVFQFLIFFEFLEYLMLMTTLSLKHFFPSVSMI